MATATKTTLNPIKKLYNRLRDERGIDRQFIKKTILPDWWDDELALNPAGFAEGVAYIARYTGFLYETLIEEGSEILPVFDDKADHVRYKKPEALTVAEVANAKNLAKNSALLLAPTIKAPYVPQQYDASQIRKALLEKDERWVSFDSLLDWCWQNGIGVLPITNFPTGAKKMNAAIFLLKEKPVIVLCMGYKSPARQLFYLAHEVGHLMLGHVKPGQSLVDQAIQMPTAEMGNEKDEEERDADEFAVELLTGQKDQFFTAKRNLTGFELAKSATQLGKSMQIDPAYIALNYAWNKNFMPVGNAAIKAIEGDGNALATMREQLDRQTNRGLLPHESYEYLIRLSDEKT